jgi:DNA replication protein DnaC
VCQEEKSSEYEANKRRKHEEQYYAPRLQKANIPARFQGDSLDTFNPANEGQELALKTARAYVSQFGDNLKAGRCLVFLGTPGTGKTRLGCGVVTALVKAGYLARYATVSQIIRTIRDTWNRESPAREEEILQDLRSLHLLVLDEVGVQFGTDAELAQLTELIDLRYQDVRPTLVISNCDTKGLVKYLGERAVDRLRENDGILLVFNWPSWRGRKPAAVTTTPTLAAIEGFQKPQ